MILLQPERPVADYYAHMPSPTLEQNVSVQLYKLCTACQRVQVVFQQQIDDMMVERNFDTDRRKSFFRKNFHKTTIGRILIGKFQEVDGTPIKHHENVLALRQGYKDGCHLCTLTWKFHASKLTTSNEWFEKAVENKKPMMIRMFTDLSRGSNNFPFNLALESEVEGYDYWHLNEGLLLSLSNECRDTKDRSFTSPISTASDQAARRGREWLDICLTEHPKCRLQRSSTLPTRLIDVSRAAEDHVIRFIISKNITTPADYAALSYCWGKKPVLKLLTGNINRFQSGVRIRELPKTIQDAIYLTQRLGINWLWVDSICIVQDSDADFARENANMSDVYRNALVTIAGLSADCSSMGLHSLRDPLMYSSYPIAQTGDGRALLVRPPLGKPNPNLVSTFWPLYRRGWVLQERILAPRTLKLGPCMMWECRESKISEFPLLPLDGDENELSSDFWSVVTEDPPNLTEFRYFWANLQPNYHGTDFTNTKDRLVALQGLITAVEQATGWKNHHGLWMPLMGRELLFKPDTSHGKTGLLPTWSWVAWNNSQHYLDRYYDDDCIADFEIMESLLSYSTISRGPPKPRPALRVHCVAIRNTQCYGPDETHPQRHLLVNLPAKDKIEHTTDDYDEQKGDANRKPEYYLLLMRRPEVLERSITGPGICGLGVVASENCPGAFERLCVFKIHNKKKYLKNSSLPASLFRDKSRRMEFVLV
jgi:hypothetical protein